MSEDKRPYRTLSEGEIRDYLDGKISGKAAHEFERHLLDDAFDREAVEGFELFQNEDLYSDLQGLRNRISHQSERKSRAWLKVAATVALLIVSVSTVWFYLDSHRAQDTKLAMEEMPQSSAAYFEAPPPADTVPIAVAEEPAPSAQQKPGPATDQVAMVDPEAEEVSPAERMAEIAVVAPLEVALDSEAAADVVLPEEEVLFNRVQGLATAGDDEVRDLSDKDFSSGAGEPAALKKSPADGVVRSRSRSTGTVSGTVTDDTGEPLPGVNVVVKGTTTGAVTDINGHYEVALPADEAILQFAFIGMESTETAVEGRAEINVELQADIASLSEVVVVGYGGEHREEPGFESAYPADGNMAYKEYLEKNLQYPAAARAKGIEGKVILKLSISPTGKVSDIEVKRSLGYGCDEEAIRLIKSGPDWVPARQNGSAIEGTARVRIKFEL